MQELRGGRHRLLLRIVHVAVTGEQITRLDCFLNRELEYTSKRFVDHLRSSTSQLDVE